MFNKLKSKIKSDSGNATIVLGIMLIVALIMVGGMMLDFSKAHHLKSSYVDAAKKATQAATMEQNSMGYLKAESIGTAIATYEAVMRPAVIEPGSYFSKCSNYQEDQVQLKVTLSELDDDLNPTKQREYTVTRANLPTVENPEQAGIVETYVNNSISTTLRNEINSGRFRPTEIQLNVTEGTENSVLPIGFKLTGKTTDPDGSGAANMKCQQFEIAAKATQFFGDNTDKYD